jgi:predicted nucleic acid-binding Zn ribbon protein
MSNQLPPPPPPTVYAHVLEYPRHSGRVTPETWQDALLKLQTTPQAIAAMRDVWAWEQAGCPTTVFAVVGSDRSRAIVEPKPSSDRRSICVICGAVFTRMTSTHKTCSEKCSAQNLKRRKARSRKTFISEMRSCDSPVCSNTFETKSSRHRFCSFSCSSYVKNIDRRAWYADKKQQESERRRRRNGMEEEA